MYIDLVVSSSERRPTLENHEWASLTSESHRQLILAPATTTKPTTYYIGIHGYSDNTTNVSWTTISATTTTEQEENEDTEMAEQEQEANQPGYTQCENCKAWIPERTKMLHEGFCLRNNIICSHKGCGRVFKKASQEYEQHWHCPQQEFCGFVGTAHDQPKHEAYVHTPKTCICDGFTADSYEALAKHRRTTCPEKLITCRYCHVSICYYMLLSIKWFKIKKNYVLCFNRTWYHKVFHPQIHVIGYITYILMKAIVEVGPLLVKNVIDKYLLKIFKFMLKFMKFKNKISDYLLYVLIRIVFDQELIIDCDYVNIVLVHSG